MNNSSDIATALTRLRPDIPDQFNEFDALRRQWRRFIASMAGSNPPPYEVLVHPSSRCNLLCDWCIGEFVPMRPDARGIIPISSKVGGHRLPDRLADPAAMLKLVRDICDFKKIVRTANNEKVTDETFEVEAVSFSGLIGEPLVAKQAVLSAVRFLRSRNKRIGLFTNGILMDDEAVRTLRQADYVIVSMDAASEETYQQLKFKDHPRKGKENFHLALDGIRRLAQERSSFPNLAINASFIVCAGNFSEVYAAAALAKELGVSSFRVKQDNSGIRKLSTDQVSEVNRQFEEIDARLSDKNFRLVRIHRHMSESEVTRKFSSCEITNLVGAVGSDGHVYPCNYHPRPGGMSYGDAISSSFAEVWNSELRQMLRKQLPSSCPPTCDPFKGRANHLLQPLRNAFNEGGEKGADTTFNTLAEFMKNARGSQALFE